MPKQLLSLLREVRRLFFPDFCCHCGNPLEGDEKNLCTSCMTKIVWTNYTAMPNNDTELRLSGRVPFKEATSLMFFTKDSVCQSLMHDFKYYSNSTLAYSLGRILGQELLASGRFCDIDAIVPVPLHWLRRLKRGYNQSRIISEGIASILNVPVVSSNLYRQRYTSSQTHKGRLERLENMKGVFCVHRPNQFANKHLLLVDDIITTGATTEACWQALNGIMGVNVSIASLAITQLR